jgi:fructokinase
MKSQPCIFGEVLFDHFPDGRRVLGGAPFNVAWHLQAFDEAPLFISRVGADGDGGAILEGMSDWGMSLAGMQTDAQLPTGRVGVSIEDDEPSYDIVRPAAWDAIEPPLAVPEMALLYHGSLALREKKSRQACQHLRDAGPSLVFIDVNLRSPWWRAEQVLEHIQGADWIKLNRFELDQLWPGTQNSRLRAEAMLKKYELRGLLLTHGSRGAELFTHSGEHMETRPGQDIVIKDTVGAGDAMAAVMVLGILRGWPPGRSLERAQDFASAMVGQRGATVRDMSFYRHFMDHWSSQDNTEGTSAQG